MTVSYEHAHCNLLRSLPANLNGCFLVSLHHRVAIIATQTIENCRDSEVDHITAPQ
jgi:hypothetical protein